MSTEPYPNESRLTALTRIEAGLARLEKHMEALAQASGVLVQLSAPHDPNANPLYYLVKIDKARFSQVVKPGDQLVLEVVQKRMMLRMGQFVCQAKVDGKVVASAEVLCAERGPQ